MLGGQVEFDVADPLIWLAYAAAITERIILATGILAGPNGTRWCWPNRSPRSTF